MIYSRLLFLYGPSLCLRRPPARPRRPPASSPRREARTGVCVLRARFLCIRLFIRFGTPPAAFRSAPSHRTRRLLPHGRGNGVRLFAPRLHTAQELYLCFFGSARPRAAFPRRRNKPAPLRPVPPAPHSAAHRPAAARGLAAPPGGGAHASRGLRLARRTGGGAACGRVRPILSPRGERRTTPKICRLTKAARCAILRLDSRRKFALRRPGIEAYAEISRAFRCVIGSLRPTGRKFQNATHFAPNFVSFFVQFRREPEFSSPGRASRRNCVPPLAEGDRPPRIRCGGAPSCTKSRYYPTNGSTLRHDFSVRKLYNICRKEEQPWNLSKT